MSSKWSRSLRTTIRIAPTVLVALTAIVGTDASGQSSAARTAGLIKRDISAFEGYTLSKPFRGQAPESPGLTFYLLNNAGNPVSQWTTVLPTRTGDFMYLRSNGEMVFTSDDGFWAVTPDGELAWNVDLPDSWQRHHEVVELPNGDFLLPAFIKKTRAEAEAAGFDVVAADACPRAPDLATLFVDNIWVLRPRCDSAGDCSLKHGYDIIWNWNLWDHKVQDDDPLKEDFVANIADHPGKVDISYIDPAGGLCSQYIQGAWTFGRFNALDFNADRNEVIISESLMNEIFVIGYGSQADLLYRWGNPYAYGAGAPFVSKSSRGDQVLSFQHRVHWIATGLPGAGHVLIFNNGADWGDSAVMEVQLPYQGNSYRQPAAGEQFDPATVVWQYDRYDAPGAFFASFVSSAQRLPNGNTLINHGPTGYFFEVTPTKQKVWEYRYPQVGYPGIPVQQQGQALATMSAYRAWRYAPDFPGLAFLNLSPADPLEQYAHTYAIDIKPGSCDNPIQRSAVGVVPVAILGSNDLDVASIDAQSVLLEGFPAAKWSIEDVSGPGVCSGGDGYPDLVMKWTNQAVGTALSSASDGSTFRMRLTGHASGGWFLGSDVVTVKK